MKEPPEVIDGILRRKGFDDYTWIDPGEIVVARWVRMKCVHACTHFGQNANCPPNTPPVDECEKLFHEYARAVLFRFTRRVESRAERHDWDRETNDRLLEVERAVFLAGYHKALLLFPSICRLCSGCVDTLTKCRHLGSSRPTLEAMGIDVFATARSVGYPIEVLTDYDQTMNRYGLLLVE
jgi:predicted metal-binding protein